MVILIFGPNAVGKSSVGRELAGRMKRAAYVESDLLRYFVAGGLVAWSAGLKPKSHPEEYRHQLAMSTKGAALLACNFGAFGFDCVIEGLDPTEWKGTGWAEEHLVGHDVIYIAVVCNPDVVIKRLQERDGTTRDVNEYIEWKKTANLPASGFDYVLDTSTMSIRECVEKCGEVFKIDVNESASAKGVEWDIVQNR
jgi:cytidylate kinase